MTYLKLLNQAKTRQINDLMFVNESKLFPEEPVLTIVLIHKLYFRKSRLHNEDRLKITKGLVNKSGNSEESINLNGRD